MRDMPTEHGNQPHQHRPISAETLHNHLNNQTLRNQSLTKQILERKDFRKKLHQKADDLHNHLQTTSVPFIVPSEEENKLSENIAQLVDLFHQLEVETAKTVDLEEHYRLESESVLALETRLVVLQSADLLDLSLHCSRMIEQFHSLQKAAHDTQASLRGLLSPVADATVNLQPEIDKLCIIYQNIIDLLPVLEKSFRSLHHTLQEEASSLTRERQQLQDHLDSLRQWIESHPAPDESKVHEYRTSVLTEIAHLHHEIELEKQNGAALLTEEEQATLQEEIDSLTERVAQTETETHDMAQQLDEEMGAAQLSYQKLCRENKQLQSKLKALRQGRKQQDKLRQLHEQLAKAREARAEAESSRQDLVSLQKKSAALAKKREELEKQIQSPPLPKGKLIALRKEIAQAKRDLEDAEEDGPTEMEATRQLIQHLTDEIEDEEQVLQRRLAEYQQQSDAEILEATDLSEKELAELRDRIDDIHCRVRERERELEEKEEQKRQVLIDRESENLVRRKIRNRTRKQRQKMNAKVKTAELSGSCVSLQPDLMLSSRFDRSESTEHLAEAQDIHRRSSGASIRLSSGGSWTTVENNGPSIRTIPPSDGAIEIVNHKFCSLPVEDTPEPTSPEARRPLPAQTPMSRQKAKKRRKSGPARPSKSSASSQPREATSLSFATPVLSWKWIVAGCVSLLILLAFLYY